MPCVGSPVARSRSRFRARRLAGLAGVGIVVGAAGCAATNTAVTVSGRTLTIYSSAPAPASGNTQLQDVLNAEQLSFDQKRTDVTAFKLKLLHVQSAKLSDNAL